MKRYAISVGFILLTGISLSGVANNCGRDSNWDGSTSIGGVTYYLCQNESGKRLYCGSNCANENTSGFCLSSLSKGSVNSANLLPNNGATGHSASPRQCAKWYSEYRSGLCLESSNWHLIGYKKYVRNYYVCRGNAVHYCSSPQLIFNLGINSKTNTFNLSGNYPCGNYVASPKNCANCYSDNYQSSSN